jgi:hypothetical protein
MVVLEESSSLLQAKSVKKAKDIRAESLIFIGF